MYLATSIGAERHHLMHYSCENYPRHLPWFHGQVVWMKSSIDHHRYKELNSCRSSASRITKKPSWSNCFICYSGIWLKFGLLLLIICTPSQGRHQQLHFLCRSKSIFPHLDVLCLLLFTFDTWAILCWAISVQYFSFTYTPSIMLYIVPMFKLIDYN